MPKSYWVKTNNKKPDSREIPVGATLKDVVMEYCPETGDWKAPTICLLDNAPILRKDWEITLLSTDQVVTFIELPLGGGGGGSNPLQILFTVVIMVVAYFVPVALLGLKGAMANLVTGAILAAGSLLAGAIFKQKAIDGQTNTGSSEQADPTYSLGGGNKARMYEVIGEGFGRMRIVPDLVANSWAYYIGNEQFYYMVLGLGRGTYQPHSIAFGDTIFWREDEGMVSGYDVELQFRDPGETVTLFPDNVDTSIEVAGQEVFNSNHPSYAGWLGPYSANSPGTKTDRIVNNIVFPQGVGIYDDEGNLNARSMVVDIEYQAIDDRGIAIGPWTNLVTQTWTLRTLTPQRFSVDVVVPEGRYQIRLRRLDYAVIEGGTLSGRWMGRMAWESLFSFLPGTLNYNQSTMALRIKATNVISQQAASNISIIYTRKLPVYNPTTRRWTEPQPTRKMAAAISHILKCDWGGRLADRNIDLDTLWRTIDNKMTQKDWTFDGYFSNSYTVWSLLMEICQPFRIVPRITNGVVTFIYDQPNRPVRHVFTAQDIVRGSMSITYNTFSDSTPDDILWSYLDEEVGYQTREVRCALPDSESRTPAIKSPIGIVKREQAHKQGIFQATVNRRRRIVVKFQCEAIGRLLLLGDVCSIEHPDLSGYATGGIAWWDESQLMVDLGMDFPKPKDQAGPFYISLSRPDGTPWGPCKIVYYSDAEVFLDTIDYNTLIRQGHGNPFDWVDFGQGRMPTIWTIQTTREFKRRMLITSVVPLDTWHYEVNCINDDPTVDEFENMETPVWEFRGQESGSFMPLSAPTNVNVAGLGTAETPILRVTWLPVANAVGYRIEQSLGATGWGLGVNVATNIAEITVAPGSVVLRIAARDSEDRVGPWTRWAGDTDALYFLAPSFNGEYFGATANLTWELPDEATGTAAPMAWDLFIVGPDGFAVVREVELHPDERQFIYTPEMALADGGPWRVLNLALRYRTVQNKLSNTAAITLVDQPPVLVIVNYEAGDTFINLTDMTVTGEETGLIILRGANLDFTIDAAIESKEVESFPFVWDNLAASTTYYFRVAAKDAFFDVTGRLHELIWSDVIQITTGA